MTKLPIRCLPIVAAVLLAGSSARADGGEREACVEASSRGQELRDDGKLIEARASFQLCSRSQCPTAVTSFCVKWLEEIEHRMPSVVFRLRDAHGADISDATVSVDGSVVTETLAGTSLPMNPGSHAIRFERHGQLVTERTIVVNSGEKDRLVDATLPNTPIAAPPVARAPAPAPTARPESSRELVVSAPSLIGFGVGFAGLATTIALASHASARADELRTTCAPRCSESDVDGVESTVTTANVALVTGIVAIAFGAAWLVLDNLRKPERR